MCSRDPLQGSGSTAEARGLHRACSKATEGALGASQGDDLAGSTTEKRLSVSVLEESVVNEMARGKGRKLGM